MMAVEMARQAQVAHNIEGVAQGVTLEMETQALVVLAQMALASLSVEQEMLGPGAVVLEFLGRVRQERQILDKAVLGVARAVLDHSRL